MEFPDPAKIVYLAHSVKPDSTETFAKNLQSTRDYFEAIHRRGVNVIVPWLWKLQFLVDDGDPEVRERGLQQSIAIAAQCWAVAPVGPRISEGMRREIESCGRVIPNLLGLPPQEAASRVQEFVLRAESTVDLDDLLYDGKGPNR